MLTNDRQMIGVAVEVLVDRIQALPRADRNDLSELIQGLFDANDDEEIESIRRTMLEIMTNAPVRSRPMVPPPEDVTPDSEAGKLARHIGQTVRGLREKAGMTQAALAEKSGLTQSHVSRIETGAHCPNHLTMRKLAEALGVEVRILDPYGD